jgi:hypothetical protein
MSQALLLNQLKQLENPDGRIVLGAEGEGEELSFLASALQGPISGDYPRFGRAFWEVSGVAHRGWMLQQSTVDSTTNWGGCQFLIDWAGVVTACNQFGTARVQGQDAIGKLGVCVSCMRELNVSLFAGYQFDNNSAALIPKDPTHLPAIWCFCSSPEFNKAVRAIDQSLKVTNATLVQVPFDLDYWQKVADERYPDGLPEPHSDDPTQWLFRGDIPSSTNPLHVAMARLLGYRWPDQQDDGLDSLLDLDGIVTTTPLVNQESVVNRLRTLLKAAYESPAPERPKGAPQVEQPRVWDESTLPTLLAQAGFPGMSLEEWIKTKFFESHCKLFHHRPFIWHIWDGRKDGFHAFVNYHKLDNKNLERLTHVYLGEWIERQKSAVEHQEPTAEARLAAAQELQRKLELIRTGEAPYDIFVRWKTKAEQPIGWEPDLNDGVRMNIRPFVEAGILKAKVNVNWNKDRGKDPKPNVSGTVERHNDLHFTIEEKRIAKMRGQQ